MKRRTALDFMIVGLVLGFVLLIAAIFSPAEAYDTYSGSFSFAIKATSLDEDNSGNEKFLTSTQTLSGTIRMFVGGDGLTTNEEGCYIKLSATDGTSICFKNIAAIATESFKSKSEKGLLVGMGEFTTTVEDFGRVTGIVYMDAQATLKQDNSNNFVSIGIKGKIGGGYAADFVFNATLGNITLTK